jgi:hypothetical protein
MRRLRVDVIGRKLAAIYLLHEQEIALPELICSMPDRPIRS